MRGVITGLTLAILLMPCIASAGVKIGNIQFDDRGKIIFANTSSGKIIFPDKTEQGTATLKGDTGPKGDKGDLGNKGDTGPQGPKGDPGQVDKAAICQVYADDNLPAPPFCGKKIIFVTSQSFNGNFWNGSGEPLDNADAKCQSAAAAGGLSGTFKAWLSLGGAGLLHAKDRITHSPAPYIRTDGTIVALHWLDLIDGWLKDPIICDEYRNCSPTPQHVWTGTSRTGEFYGDSCLNWQSSESWRKGTVGSNGEIDSKWTADSSYAAYCHITGRLYCFEQ